ncbi:unnamed protein product [Dicrocoelium dendriticum]|nr:unnamed protein product [Dicrocoelium dendriticum]
MSERHSWLLAAVADRVVHIWSRTNGTDELADGNSASVYNDYSWSYTPDSTAACRSLAWHPRSCKLATLHPTSKCPIHIQRVPVAAGESIESEQPKWLTDVMEDGDCLGHITCFAFPQRSGRFIALGRSNGVVTVHGMQKQPTVTIQFACFTRQITSASFTCIAWALNDSVLVAGALDGNVFVRPVTTVDSPWYCLPHPSRGPHSFQPSPCLSLHTCRADSTCIAAGFASGLVVVWRLQSPLSLCSDDLLCHLCVPETIDSLSSDFLSIASSPVDRHILITCGAPDLCLRIWNMERVESGLCTASLTRAIMPLNKTVGYCASDISPDGTLLVVGLANGFIQIYRIENLNQPEYEIRLPEDSPVVSLSFAITTQSYDEVKFSDSVSENPIIKRCSKRSPVPRKPLVNVTNTEEYSNASQSAEWSAVFHGISLPELSDISDSSSLRPSPSVEPVPPSSAQSKRNLTAHGFRVSPFGTTNAPSTLPMKPASAAPDGTVFNAFTSGDPCDAVRLDQFRAEIQMSHCNMLYHFSRLERKLESMFEHFSQSVLDLKKENNELRLELERRFRFY